MLGRSTLLGSVKDALVDLLTQGSWSTIKTDHARVGLAWRPELGTGWGKPKYVRAVLDALSDADISALAARSMEKLTDRRRTALQDALWWLEANGHAEVTEITRRRLARELDGRVMVRDQSPWAFMARCAEAPDEWSAPSLAYGTDGYLYRSEVDLSILFGGQGSKPQYVRYSHAQLFDEWQLFEWPDKRVFVLLEQLVHPRVRNEDDEQDDWVAFLNGIVEADGLQLVESDRISKRRVFTIERRTPGSLSKPKNLVFASKGPKPELGFKDAVSNDIVILKHAEHCLIYEDGIGEDGLSWEALIVWWAKIQNVAPTDQVVRKALGQRLLESVGSRPEQHLFSEYFRQFSEKLGPRLPALLPQVYLHYDPVSLRELERRGETKRFLVQRMDFLLLLRDRVRVVLEVDGQQHYSEGEEPATKPSPAVYAETVKADRALRLAGYEVYRFGGYELMDRDRAGRAVQEFFNGLFRRHGVSVP
jgi:hypothetical protein